MLEALERSFRVVPSQKQAAGNPIFSLDSYVKARSSALGTMTMMAARDTGLSLCAMLLNSDEVIRMRPCKSDRINVELRIMGRVY